MEQPSMPRKIFSKILNDVAFCIKNIATDAVVEVIEKAIDKRKAEKYPTIVDAVVVTSPVKYKPRKRYRYNANKNN